MYRFWLVASATLAIVGVAYETFLYARRELRLAPAYALTAGYLALFFPAWHTLASSDLLPHALCVWLLLLGYRLVKRAGRLLAGAGVLCIVASFQLNSLIAVLAGLCGADCLLEYSRSGAVARATWRRSIALGVLAAAALANRMVFSPAFGDYEGYNRIALFDSMANIRLALRLVCRYLVWPAVVLGIAASSYLTALALAGIEQRRLPPATILRRFVRSCVTDRLVMLVLMVLFFSGALPYVAALKYARFINFNDWFHRNAYTICLPLSLMGAWLSQIMAGSLAGYARHVRVIPVLCCCGFASLLYAGYSQKVERASFELGIVEAMQAIAPPQAGMVYLHYAPMHGLKVRTYESTWLLWRAYKKVDWISVLGDDSSAQGYKLDQIIQPVLNTGNRAQRLMQMLPDFHQPPCYVDIALTGMRLTKLQAWEWVFGLHRLPPMTASVQKVKCGGKEIARLVPSTRLNTKARSTSPSG